MKPITKKSGAKAPSKIKVASLSVRFKKPGAADASSWEDPGLQVPLVDVTVAQLRQYARAADSDDPAVREVGFAGLRRLATQMLEADAAVRRLRAIGGDKRALALTDYAMSVGYPANCERKAFTLGAAEHFGVDVRTIERWYAVARKMNLLT